NFHQGVCAFRRGRYPDAVAAFRACITLAPDRAEGYYNRAMALESLGRADEAARDFRRAAALDPALGNGPDGRPHPAPRPAPPDGSPGDPTPSPESRPRRAVPPLGRRTLRSARQGEQVALPGPGAAASDRRVSAPDLRPLRP